MKKKRASETNLEKIDEIELSLSRIIILYYCEAENFESLNDFILCYDRGVASKKIFDQFYSFLLCKIQENPKAIKLLINVYGILKNYKKAIKLSLEQGDEELAIKWAKKNGMNDRESVSNKKLWLMIA